MNDSASPAPKVYIVSITQSHAGQRIDNFLVTHLKGVPKSRIYRLLRKGEVRVNKKRVDPEYRLAYGDEVRIPPVRQTEPAELKPGPGLIALMSDNILYEDDDLLIINKPAGMAVHAGSNIKFGIIEVLRHMRPYQPFLELAHRLDRETSGCLILAKNRNTLLQLHDAFKNDGVKKCYQVLVHGVWPAELTHVNFALIKGQAQAGERMVMATKSEKGKASLTEFKVLRRFTNHTLLQARLYTGRTHQIRVHTAESGYPIIGDEKYGKRELDKLLRPLGAKGMYLHSALVELHMPGKSQCLHIEAPLPPHWEALIKLLP